ncbi:hypothetical protein [Kordia sp.]|uniref:hypothetical protein n=1 Tax=Kordia sp. TaxID=1965332 RepID=UPI003D6ABF80
MKTKTILSVILCLVFSMGLQAQRNTVLIFQDYSGSVKANENHIAKQKTVLKTILLKHIQKPNDRVIVSYLFHNSASVTNQREFVFENPTKREAKTKVETTRQKSQLLRAKFRFITNVLQAFETRQKRSHQTRILEAIPKIHALAGDKDTLKIIFLSDMLESSPRRELSRINSKLDAETKAKYDAQRIINDFGISKVKYPNITIDCYLPLGMMENQTAYQFLNFYWTTVFKIVFDTENLKFHIL